MRTKVVAVLSIILGHGTLLLAQQIPAEIGAMGYPDLILVNGKVVTMDDRGTAPDTAGHIYQAMAVKGKKIMALGSDEQINRLVGPATKAVDLKGRTVIPGLIETHDHVYGNAFTRYGPKVGLTIPSIKLTVETQSTPEATSKAIRDTVLNAIQAQKLPKGQWLDVALSNENVRAYQGGIWLFTGKVNRKSLDPVTRDYPVHVQDGVRHMFNGKAIEELKAVFPEWEEHAETETRRGAVADGYEGIMTANALGPEFFWKDEPLEKLAETFRMQGEAEAQRCGVTTIGTRIPPPRYIAAYYLLNRQGRMPYRLAYGLEAQRGRLMGLNSTRDFYKALVGQWNTMSSGNEMLWCHGMANEIWDSQNVGACFGPDLPAAPEVKAVEKCVTPDSKPWVANKAAAMNGWRLVGTHGVASHGVRLFIRMLDEVVKEGSYSEAYIRNSRPTLEHVEMVGAAPDILAGLKKYGIILSIGAQYLAVVPRWIEDYGEAARSFAQPIKTYIREGIRVVGQLHTAACSETRSHWLDMYTHVTRKAIGANLPPGASRQTLGLEGLIARAPVILPEEAIDRTTALKMYTTWAAEYVLAEDNLGSLEVGKYADFAVLDRDYFTISESEIPKVQVVMTGLNGKLVYDRDGLASAK